MQRVEAERAGAKHEAMKHIGQISQVAVVSLLVAMAAACSATRPTKYYVLDAPSAPPATTPAPIPVRLVVGHVTAPNLYRDSRLVYGTGSVQLGTYEYERWSAPPVDLLQDMLVKSLRSSGQYSSVSRIGSLARGDYIVRGHLYALYEVDKPALAGRFAFQLELFDPTTGAILWSGSYNHDEPVQGKQVSDVVEALDRNVEAGLQQLTSGLNQYLASHAPPERSGH
jgi:ABC-type uncharacterized transport system auxiliary subunit